MNIKKIILAFAASAMLAGGCTSLDMDPVSCLLYTSDAADE
mgnify:CR=1 FL=1